MAPIYKHPQGHENSYMPMLLQMQQIKTGETTKTKLATVCQLRLITYHV